jgi:hypothetical protein
MVDPLECFLIMLTNFTCWSEILQSLICFYVLCISFASFNCWHFLRKQYLWENLLWLQLCTQSLSVCGAWCCWDFLFSFFSFSYSTFFFLQGLRCFEMVWDALRWFEILWYTVDMFGKAHLLHLWCYLVMFCESKIGFPWNTVNIVV